MAKPLAADIIVVDAAGLLSSGPGFVNADGLAAKAGGFVAWQDIAACRLVQRQMGNASTGALAAGGVGLLFGPPVAGAAAGADLLISVGIRQSKALQACVVPAQKPGALQRMRGLIPGRTKGDA